jgi:hypothetical protein
VLDRVLCCLVRRIDQNDLVQVVSVGSLCCTFDELTRTTPDRSFQLVRSNQRRGITPEVMWSRVDERTKIAVTNGAQSRSARSHEHRTSIARAARSIM